MPERQLLERLDRDSDPLPHNMDTYTAYETIDIVRERHSDVDKAIQH